MGLFAGIATIGMGATVLPLSLPNPEVAGVQTNIPYDPQLEESLAQSTEVPTVCWNQVEVIDDDFFWRNSCRGIEPKPNQRCVEKPLELSTGEELAYRAWWSQNQVLSPDCQATPGEIPDELPVRNNFN
jgi:hypothetical protein